MAVLLALSSWPAGGFAAQAAANNADPPVSDNPGDIDQIYKSRLSADITGDSYAELIEALYKQGRLSQAEQILIQAKAKGFSDNPKILTLAASLAYAHAQKAESFNKYDLYNAASVMLCKRAIESDPTNKSVLETLHLAEFNTVHRERARQFEESGNLDLAEAEYQKLFQKRNDDVDAALGLARVYKRKFEKREIASAELKKRLKDLQDAVDKVNQELENMDRPTVQTGPTGDFGSNKLYFVPGMGLSKHSGVAPKKQGPEKETESNLE